MDGREGGAGQVAEEILCGTVAHQVAELVIAAVHQPLPDETPLADDNPLSVNGLVVEGVAADDVLRKEVAHRFDALRLGLFAVEVAVFADEKVEQPFAAGFGVVGQQLDAVDAADALHGRLLVLQLRVLPSLRPLSAYCELSAKDFDKEVAVPAGRFEEAAVEALGFGLHQVEHGVHLPRVGEYLAVVGHPPARFDLTVHSLRVFARVLITAAGGPGHKKSAEVSYPRSEALGSPQQVR